MFRRGPFRRTAGPGGPIGAPGRAALIRANQLNEAGEYLKAAAIFERVAQRMENRLRPNRAAFLFLQASHALLLAKQVDQSMELAKRALALLAQYQHWRPYQQGGNMMVQELSRLGYAKQATEIQALLDQHKIAHPGGIQGARASQTPALRLPGKCPSCGAPLRSDMAEWIDGASAECPYCGSVVQAE